MSLSTPAPYRCPTCKTANASVNPRKLAVFIDGTSNKPGPKKTNVKKLHDVLSSEGDPQLRQHKRYLEGIGTYDDNLRLPTRMGKAIHSAFEMAFAWNVEKNVKNAYGWLVTTYQGGDHIYLFGFSRGAYQVRALAGMIHEVGLLRESEHSEERVDQAYRRYISLDPHNPKTKEAAVRFKKDFCWPTVRIHFVGVWDTVSSLGLIKTAVHITASASVTNACHFRHALALDERRVKFMPEYFSEVNARRSNIRSPRSAVGDVKEVWFAGGHSDVGGMSRPHTQGVPNQVDDEHQPVHSGNVPLVWMKREAAARGLVFGPEALTWGPEDVDFGKMDTMKWYWRVFEVVRIYHQVSFSGTGKHAWRKHGFRPRSVIPNQQIHFSVLPGDMYKPRGTLTHHVDISMMPQKPSGELSPTELWTTELLDEGSITSLLTSLLNDQQRTLNSLGEVLLLLDFRLDIGHTEIIPKPEWLENSICKGSGFDKFALTVIHDVIFGFSTSEALVKDARDALNAILPSPDHSDFPRALYIVRFSARHRDLRQRFIAHDEVIQALMLALDSVSKNRSGDLFPLVTDSLCCLIDSGEKRDYVIGQLTASSDTAATGKTRLLLALEVRAPNHLATVLKMIASLAEHHPRSCMELKPKIIDLAKQGSPVGSAAVEALVALNVPVPRDVHISSILGYLGDTLPRLDAEVGSTSGEPLNDASNLPPALQGNGSEQLNEELMRKLVLTITSWNTHQRTAATLTLLKLCNCSTVRDYCLQNKVLGIFMKQMERKKTSLLAAYALTICLKHNMWTSDDFPRAAQLIVSMLDKGWFDDAVGWVEGCEIISTLVASGDLRQQVLELGVVTTLTKQLEGGDHHKTRMSLICLEIFGRVIPVELMHIVAETLARLRDGNKNVQKKGVKILSALAQTKAGEEAIMPHVIEIVKMLLPPPEGSSQSRSQLFGPAAAVYDLCKNETLRERILNSTEYKSFRRRRYESNFYPPSKGTTRSKN